MRRWPLLVFIAFVALDFANPLLPGTCEFEKEESKAFEVHSISLRPIRTAASGDGPHNADRQQSKSESAPRLMSAGRMASEWLAIRQAHAPAPPPPPASEDH
jgi:hypothetical protein